MKTRIISGIVILLFGLAIIVFNSSFPLSLNIVIAIISAGCVYELIKVVGLLKRWEFLFPSMIVSVLVPFSGIAFNGTFTLYCIYSFVMFLVLILHHKTVTFKDLVVVYSMCLMIPSALQTIVNIRALSDNHGMFFVLIAIGSAWVPDIGAYFAGTFFGKHKLCPDISPKKTVEGFVGGIIFSIIVMMVAGYVFSELIYGGTVAVNYLSLAIIGAVCSLISVVGDLSFSIVKRNCGVKDFGNLIPGHGGFLDRFDSVIFTSPFVYLILSYLPLVK
ncbi:MAG: phosphatidate cytidylyltransferase [Clostridia bacterium]